MIEVYFDYSGGVDATWSAAVFVGTGRLPWMLLGGELPAPGSEAEALHETVRTWQQIGPNGACRLYTDDNMLVQQSHSLPEGFELCYTARNGPRHIYAHETARLYRKQLALRAPPVPDLGLRLHCWMFGAGQKPHIALRYGEQEMSLRVVKNKRWKADFNRRLTEFLQGTPSDALRGKVMNFIMTNSSSKAWRQKPSTTFKVTFQACPAAPVVSARDDSQLHSIISTTCSPNPHSRGESDSGTP